MRFASLVAALAAGVAALLKASRPMPATMPTTPEMLYQEYLSVATFSLAAILALVTLLLKTDLEIRHAGHPFDADCVCASVQQF